MNVASLLLAPWPQRSTRILALAIPALLGVVDVLLMIFEAKPAGLLIHELFCGGCLLLFWAFLFPNLLILATDARQLRLAGVQRTAALSLIFYAAVSVLLPTLVFSLAGADGAVIGLVFTLCVLGGLTFALVPAYISTFMGFLPSLRLLVLPSLTGSIPSPGDPRFLPWASIAALFMLVYDVLRWRQLVRRGAPRQDQWGYSSALVQNFHRRSMMSFHSSLNKFDSAQQARQVPTWMQSKVDLRRVGPASPGTTLRVVLGGCFTPKTLKGHLKSLLPIPIFWIFPVVILLALGREHHHIAEYLTWHTAMAGISGTSLMVSVILTMTIIGVVVQRWDKVNAELPLLALLPGFHDADHARRAVLRVTLWKPLTTLGILTVLMLAAAALAHLTDGTLGVMVVDQLGCAAALTGSLLATLGGKPMPRWLLTTLFMVLAIVIGSMAFTPLLKPDLSSPWLIVPCGIWLLVGGMMLWFGLLGWRGLQERPHIFLPSA